jgi:hypothetical protein
MTAVQKQLGAVLLLMSWAAAQSGFAGTASVQDIKVVREGNDVRVEVILTNPVKPAMVTARNPDRLVLDLPHTLSSAKQKYISVDYNGVRRVRVGLNSSAPPVTRLVVDLDEAHPYVIHSNGRRISLTVGPALNQPGGAPAAGASARLAGIFRRRPNPPQTGSNDSAPDLPPPPPSEPPIVYGKSANTANSTVASSHPTAANPDRGGLQEGTVFPTLGAPGTGNVPAQHGITQEAGFAASSTAPSVPNEQQPTAALPVTSSSASIPSAVVVAQASPQPRADMTSAASTSPFVVPPPANIPAPASSSQPAAAIAAVTTSVPAPAQTETHATSPQVAAGQAAQASAPAVVEAKPAEAQLATGQTTVAQPASPSGPPLAVEAINVQPKSPASIEAAVGATTEAEQPALILRAADPNLRTVFKVKYVAEGIAYLDGGRTSGLTEGMKLEIKESDLPSQQGATVDPSDPRVTAELEVTAVAETSAVTDIHLPKRPVKPGDLAYLSSGDAQALVQQNALSATRTYPAVVTFTEGDPLEEEAREEVPRPPLPSVNRARGRIGFDYLGTVSHGTTSMTSSDLGMVARMDMTRIGGTFWNLSGYWRGRLNATSGPAQPTLQDLINRTYHLSLSYDNPNSRWVAGFGRLYLPWAPSLDTIDGGYFGARIAHGVTTGIFVGSTPDPTSWDYNPDQQLGGTFINFEGGTFDAFRFTSTEGLGVGALKWQINRPFIFLENAIFYKRYLSVYYSMQADSPRGTPATPAPGPGLSRSFFTVRIQPIRRLEFDFNHNYFRDIPTFDPLLIGTGLLDKYLFQGFSAGVRIEVVKNIFVYTDQGLSNRTGDAKSSLNQAYGITFNHLPWLALRADVHYSRFNSSFGAGSYESFSVSRNFSDNFRLDFLAGEQTFTGASLANGTSRFVNANIESNLGAHYFLQGGYTIDRGQLSYDQWMFTIGYRFDSKAKHQ